MSSRRRARADALEGFRWIAEQSEQAATKWYAGLERALDKLKEHPERHPIAADESEQFEMTLRQMPYGKRRGVYRILFSIEDEAVVVHHIRHGAREPIET